MNLLALYKVPGGHRLTTIIKNNYSEMTIDVIARTMV